MAKLANPWKCDNAACGKLRESDANHWWLIQRCMQEGKPYIVIAPWDSLSADAPGIKHGCGVECSLRIAARLMDDMVTNPDPARADTAKGKAA